MTTDDQHKKTATGESPWEKLVSEAAKRYGISEGKLKQHTEAEIVRRIAEDIATKYVKQVHAAESPDKPGPAERAWNPFEEHVRRQGSVIPGDE